MATIPLFIGIPLFYFWVLWRNRIYIVTRNESLKDENDNIIVGLSDANGVERMNRENILESLDFLYGAYGKLIYMPIAVFYLHMASSLFCQFL
jgi:hypothetical protein